MATFVNNVEISPKRVALLLVFGLTPALAVFGVFQFSKTAYEAAFRKPPERLSWNIGETIDRNLFERYGDAQAFGLNRAAHDSANWEKPSSANPLISSMNGYMTAYGIYRLMLLLDTSGRVVAVNSVNVQQASAGANMVSDTIDGVSEAADGNHKSAEQVLVASQEVSSQAVQLQEAANEFLKNVAAA